MVTWHSAAAVHDSSRAVTTLNACIPPIRLLFIRNGFWDRRTAYPIALAVAVLQMCLALALGVDAFAAIAQQRLTLFVRDARILERCGCGVEYERFYYLCVFML